MDARPAREKFPASDREKSPFPPLLVFHPAPSKNTPYSLMGNCFPKTEASEKFFSKSPRRLDGHKQRKALPALPARDGFRTVPTTKRPPFSHVDGCRGRGHPQEGHPPRKNLPNTKGRKLPPPALLAGVQKSPLPGAAWPYPWRSTGKIFLQPCQHIPGLILC